jgi:dienelactone hydrolase
MILAADQIYLRLDAFVIYPDFFEGKPWDNEAFPPRNGESNHRDSQRGIYLLLFLTDEEQAGLQAFFGAAANLSERLPQMTTLADQLRAEGAKFVGTIGFCWVSLLVPLIILIF